MTSQIPEWLECPYCYRELHCTELGLEQPEPPRPRRPKYNCKPGPERQARMRAAIKFLRNLPAPHYATAKELHEWVRMSFGVTGGVAGAVAADLRKLCNHSVGWSQYRNGHCRMYWHQQNATKVQPRIRSKLRN